MVLILQNAEPFHYELEKVCRIFCPDEEIRSQEKPLCAEESFYAVCTLGEKTARARLVREGAEFVREYPLPPRAAETECERLLAAALFHCLCECFSFSPAWGMLTGVRPAKMFKAKAMETDRRTALSILREQYFVSPQKASLAAEVSDREDEIRALSSDRSFSLYVSIPFCPSRCSYCSFVSHSIEHSTDLIEPYLDKLCLELEELGGYARQYGLNLETVYVGGGTPSILTAEQTARLLSVIRRHFSVPGLGEFTFESGRPDTLDETKFRAMKEGGVNRVSINPQTFRDEILRLIGRRHTAAQTLEAFAAARRAGIPGINMDLIAGLPGDTAQGFENSLRQTIALDPENITVHALSMKRSSRQVTDGLAQYSARGEEAAQMLETADTLLRQAGYQPYYMYRQSKTVGNLENIGWAKPGWFGLYNIYMMDETHTILSAGAGAVSKLRDPHSTTIVRIFNYKYPYEYISRYEEMARKKEEIHRFFDRFPL